LVNTPFEEFDLRKFSTGSCPSSETNIEVSLFVIFAFFLLLGFSIEKAEAVPSFAKKYSAPCTLCHSTWPRLNKIGYQFKINGYQLPDGRDGSDFGKVSPDWNLHLDSGDANPPVSLRLKGGYQLQSPLSDLEGRQSTRFACCTEPNSLNLYAAGSAAKDVAYFISYPLGGKEMEQGYIRLVNMLGQGGMALDIGVIRTADYDIVPQTREWFGEPNLAYNGNESFRGFAHGLHAGASDTGIRIYGNPGYHLFTYDLVYVTGVKTIGGTYRGHGEGVGATGRIDWDNFGLSIKYWQVKSGATTFTRVDTGGVGTFLYNFNEDGEFKPNRLYPNETTVDIILNMKYETERWRVEFVFDKNSFRTDERKDPTGMHTYVRGVNDRTGLSVAWVYRVSSSIAIGARYAQSTTKDFSEMYDDLYHEIPEANAAKADFKIDFMPAQNVKFALQATMDTSDADSRKTIMNGVLSEYDQQNKLLLLWDLAI